MVRRPAVAGQFYEGSAEELRRQIEACFLHPLGPGQLPSAGEEGRRQIVALVCPHAGYMYSGPTAAQAYYRLAQEKKPEVVVMVGPNHSERGADAAVYSRGKWLMPLGEVEINEHVAKAIIEHCPYAEEDLHAHTREHSLEVQVPFLQYCFRAHPPFQIVPIAMSEQTPEVAISLGQTIASAVKDQDALLIASTDFTHYEPHERAVEKDRTALERIKAMDAEGLFQVVYRHHVSMCGYGATAAVMQAAKELGAVKAEVAGYSTSGDITGDRREVVGYGAVVITRGVGELQR